MHQHILPMLMMPNMPMFCVQNCGCRNPDRAHCISCHKQSDKFKIQNRSEMCCESTDDLELDYLFVIDFECTCDEAKRLTIQEIIEFPIVVIDLKKLEIVDQFHSFVRPTIFPTLTDFCTKLTGITQAQVDSAPILAEVLKSVDVFLEKYISNGLQRVAVLNDCDSDIRNFLRNETAYKQLAVKPVFKEFIDLRRIFPSSITCKPSNIDHMLASLDLTFEGIKHSGIADAKNIARVALEIAKRDFVYTHKLKEHMHPYQNPHYYEHLVIIATQPKMKNNVELAMIAHDLRKGTTLWNNFGQKHIKNQEVKKELFEFLDKVGIDVDNSILCVQGKLENEFKGFFSPISSDNNNNTNNHPSSSQSAAKQSNHLRKQSDSDNTITCDNYKQTFFTTYFSLNKISRVAGVQVSPYQSRYHDPFPMRYSNNHGNSNYNNSNSALNTSNEKSDNSQAIKPQGDDTAKKMMMVPTRDKFTQHFLNQQISQELAKENLSRWLYGLHGWNGVAQSPPQTETATIMTRLTSMCSVIESALQNGFIFTKDLASTISLKRSFTQV